MGELTAKKDQSLSGWDIRFLVPFWTETEPDMAGYPANRNRISGTSLVFCGGTGTNCEACELKFGAAQVIMRNGVSKGTNTSCCHPLSVSEHSRDTKPYFHLLMGLYCA